MKKEINSDTTNTAVELRTDIEASLKKLAKYIDKFEGLEYISSARSDTVTDLYFTTKFMIENYQEVHQDENGYNLYISRLYNQGSRLSPYHIEV